MLEHSATISKRPAEKKQFRPQAQSHLAEVTDRIFAAVTNCPGLDRVRSAVD